MAKYIVDIDSLISCLSLLPNRGSILLPSIALEDVIDMIEKFPKDPLINNLPIYYTSPIILTSPAVVPDSLRGWEVTCENV